MADVRARNARNKRKGADFEIDLDDGFREEGFDVARLVRAGKNDTGDLVIKEANGVHLVIEAKNAAFQPGPFLGEAATERLNYAAKYGVPLDKVDSVVIVKRRGKSWKEAFVLTTVSDYFGLDLGDA